MEKIVQILMSTYNGEKYIREQIDSFFKQTYPSVRILVRDDGSTDGTISILEEYAKQFENFSYYKGENIGVVQSFLQLLRNSDDSVAYYAFADQDDVWFPEKISTAVEMLAGKKCDMPCLYCSDVYVTDQYLNVIKIEKKNPMPSFGNALVQNICTGCTAVMNRSLRDIINKTEPRNIVMHDWWFYLLASLNGDVLYDNTPYMYYRQHGNNEWGTKTRKIDILKYRLSQLKKKRGYIYRQNEEILRNFQNMNHEKRELLVLVQKSENGILGKLKLILNRKIYRTDRENDVVYRIAVLIGKL